MPVALVPRRAILIREVAYYPILKNAHTSLKQWLSAAGFRTVTFDDEPDVDSFTVIREPFARYLSALHTMWRGDCHEWFKALTWDEFVDRVASMPYVWTRNDNPHFDPQVRDVERMRRPTLFTMETLGDIRDWLERRGVVLGPLPRLNESTPADIAGASTRIDRQSVLDYYAADVALYASLTEE